MALRPLHSQCGARGHNRHYFPLHHHCDTSVRSVIYLYYLCGLASSGCKEAAGSGAAALVTGSRRWPEHGPRLPAAFPVANLPIYFSSGDDRRMQRARATTALLFCQDLLPSRPFPWPSRGHGADCQKAVGRQPRTRRAARTSGTRVVARACPGAGGYPSCSPSSSSRSRIWPQPRGRR